MREVDVAILGAGSAGLFAMSQVKRETDNYVLINGGELGTTCARVGCMPSKVLIQVAEDFHRKSIFEREGIDGGEELTLDVPASMEHVQDLRDVFVDRTLGATDAMDEEHLIDGYAKFVSNDTVEVNGEQIKAKSIIIATGSTPIVPADWQDFSDDVVTTDEFFELEDLPASMAVIGLGSIGLEIGQATATMKTPNTVAVMRQPKRSKSGSIAQAMAGTSTNAPARLPMFDHPRAMALRRWNHRLSMVIRGIQLPRP